MLGQWVYVMRKVLSICDSASELKETMQGGLAGDSIDTWFSDVSSRPAARDEPCVFNLNCRLVWHRARMSAARQQSVSGKLLVWLTTLGHNHSRYYSLLGDIRYFRMNWISNHHHYIVVLVVRRIFRLLYVANDGGFRNVFFSWHVVINSNIMLGGSYPDPGRFISLIRLKKRWHNLSKNLSKHMLWDPT